jgi:hypothetical protein
MTPRGANISADGRYRYLLWRRWADGATAVFVMLNPSTAGGGLADERKTPRQGARGGNADARRQAHPPGAVRRRRADGTSVYPSIARIAKFAQCSARQVKRTLGTVSRGGVRRRSPPHQVVRQGGGGPGSTTEYAINVGVLDDLERARLGCGGRSPCRAMRSPDADEDNGGPKGDTEKGDTVSPLKGDSFGRRG